MSKKLVIKFKDEENESPMELSFASLEDVDSFLDVLECAREEFAHKEAMDNLSDNISYSISDDEKDDTEANTEAEDKWDIVFGTAVMLKERLENMMEEVDDLLAFMNSNNK